MFKQDEKGNWESINQPTNQYFIMVRNKNYFRKFDQSNMTVIIWS